MNREITLNHWTTVFLLASVQGLFLALVLFQHKKGNKKATRLLATDILLFSLMLLYYVAFWTGFAANYRWINGWTEPFVFLFGPLTYLYLIQFRENSEGRDSWLHFMPFMLHSLWMIPFILRNVFGRIELLRANFFSHPDLIQTVTHGWIVLSTVSLLCYVIAMHVLLLKDKMLLNKFALEEEKKKHAWMKRVVWFYSGFAVASVSYWILVWINRLRPEYDYMISIAMSLFIYMVGYLGFRQPEIFHGYHLSNGQKRARKYAKSSLKEDQAKQCMDKLSNLMEIDKLYLDSDLKIQQLAEVIGISTHHLSQIINEQLHQSYTDYINAFRIREAKRLLLSPAYKNQKILSIAFDSGFQNKATFNAAFKKATGMAPTEFRKHHLNVLVN